MAGAFQQAQGTGVGEGDVFDPVVGLGIGREQSLEVQAVQAAVGNDEDLGGFAEHRLGGSHQHLVERAAVGILGFGRILRSLKSFAIATYDRIDFGRAAVAGTGSSFAK